jgi:predicted  nucleic acid-binding Zn-ribbon protein
MKYMPGFTDFFMSPVTGRIKISAFPDLTQNYVWIGNRNDRPIPSPIIIDLRLEIIELRNRLSKTRFILQAASANFDSSQALNELIPGILKHTDGIVAIAIPWVDYVPPILPEKNIWIGNADDAPEPYPRIFLENLPSMLSIDPTKLLGAYNLYRGSPSPLSLGIPEIVKTLHITNMADLQEGYLWIGTDSSNPLNYGSNRPVEIKILPLDNMANLPHKKIWRGDVSDRPVPSDDLTDLEAEVEEIKEDIDEINTELGDINNEIGDINTELGDINTELGDINVELGDLLSEISSILESIATITSNISSILDAIATLNTQITGILEAITTINTQISTLFEAITQINIDLGGINLRLDGIDVSLGGLQAQIDTNVASGLDHLADLQLQIDTGIESGMDHLAEINEQLADINTLISTLQGDITTINSQISTINSQITTINTAISDIEGDITDIQNDISTINTTITDIQGDITTIEGNISTINSQITTILGDINNITTVLLPAVYTYIDDAITNITNNFIAGGVIDMDDNRITNLPCDPVETNDAVSFCFLWHILHDEVTITWS